METRTGSEPAELPQFRGKSGSRRGLLLWRGANRRVAGADLCTGEDGRVSERLTYDELAELVDAHVDALLLYARQWSHASAADVVQEAFLQLVRRVQANDPPENVVGWLYRVVRNELITQHHSACLATGTLSCSA